MQTVYRAIKTLPDMAGRHGKCPDEPEASLPKVTGIPIVRPSPKPEGDTNTLESRTRCGTGRHLRDPLLMV